MRTHRRTLLATGLVAALTIAGITAAIANDPPPRIAFLANGIVPADALAAGPIAGQLGAPIFTTAPDFLVDSTADALDDYNPELVIVMGGPVAISDAVLAQVSSATGLSVVAPNPPPTSGIVRAAGQDRFETAAAAAALLAAYDPAYLPTDMQAADSDELDGKDSTAFLGATAKAADADKLDGKDSSAFQPAGNYLGKTEKAADSDKLDGKDSSAFLPSSGDTTVSTLDWRNNEGEDFTISQFATQTTIGSGTFAGFVAVNVEAPTSIVGHAYAFKSVEICLGSGGGRVNSVDFFVTHSSTSNDGGRTFVLQEDGAWNQGSSGCQTYVASSPVVIGPQGVAAVAMNLDAAGTTTVNRTTFTMSVGPETATLGTPSTAQTTGSGSEATG